MLAHDEVPLHHRDLLGIFRLAFPLGKHRTAVGTHPVGLDQFVRLLFDGQLGLLARPVTVARWARRWQFSGGLAFLARRPEHLLPQRRHLLLQPHNLQLQLLGTVVALELGIFRNEFL